jgi:hypothetical protein
MLLNEIIFRVRMKYAYPLYDINAEILNLQTRDANETHSDLNY